MTFEANSLDSTTDSGYCLITKLSGVMVHEEQSGMSRRTAVHPPTIHLRPTVRVSKMEALRKSHGEILLKN